MKRCCDDEYIHSFAAAAAAIVHRGCFLFFFLQSFIVVIVTYNAASAGLKCIRRCDAATTLSRHFFSFCLFSFVFYCHHRMRLCCLLDIKNTENRKTCVLVINKS